MEMAVVRWNVLQATLRQPSCKLSESLVLLTSSCVGVVIMLAYKTISLALSDESFAVRDMAGWMGLLFAPVLVFLYVLSKSAAVTEKVERLGPLVNSWIFEDAPILDEQRQYVVQYMFNSRAARSRHAHYRRKRSKAWLLLCGRLLWPSQTSASDEGVRGWCRKRPTSVA